MAIENIAEIHDWVKALYDEDPAFEVDVDAFMKRFKLEGLDIKNLQEVIGRQRLGYFITRKDGYFTFSKVSFA